MRLENVQLHQKNDGLSSDRTSCVGTEWTNPRRGGIAGVRIEDAARHFAWKPDGCCG